MMLMHTGGNLYGSMLTSSLILETVLVDSPGLDFTILKTIYYTAVALVLLIATKGQLGDSGEEDAIPLSSGNVSEMEKLPSEHPAMYLDEAMNG